jgi:hypothetical protein
MSDRVHLPWRSPYVVGVKHGRDDRAVPTLTDPQPTLSSCLAKIMGSASTLAGC